MAMENPPCSLPPFRVFPGPNILAEKQNFNITRSNVPHMWVDTQGAGAFGVILDTGKPKPHLDLNIRGESIALIPGESEFDEESFHSTWISGLSEGVANNDMGVIGIAHQAIHHYGKVLSNAGSGSLKSLMDGLDWCLHLRNLNQCDAINLSLGFPNWLPNIPELEAKCQELKDAGILIFAANGNAAGSIGQPAKYPSVVAVSAVEAG